MTPDAALELSIEQLIGVLDKKLTMECAQVQSAMPPMSRVQVATLAAGVDALEKRARDVLYEVLSLRNSLRPVNRLPPEVLTSCATFVSDTDPGPIVFLTHVCRYWRRSITSNPKSWASITSRRKRLAPLYLERAGAVPLAVNITIPDLKEDSSFLGALLPHATRISHLSLTKCSSTETVAGDLPGLFTSPMPHLTSLELQQTAEPDELFPLSEAPVPPVFRNVSNLKSLRLARAPLYPALFNIPSLVELKLAGYTNPFHFGSFIDLLASNFNLEIVDLDIKFVEGSVGTDPAQMVSLTRLRRLSIVCAEPIDARGLLSSISLPCGTCLKVSCTQPTSPNLCLPSPPTPIQKILTPITAMRFQVSPREMHAFGDNGSSFSFLCPGTSHDPEVRLFPTASTREFHVDLEPWALTPAISVFLLTKFPGLETLIVANSKRWFTGAFDSLAGQPSLCPSLKTVAFFNCEFTPEAMEEFVDVVVRRKGSEATWLYRVVIVSSTGALPDYKLIQQLRQHVPCVNVGVDDKLPDLS